MQLTRRPFVPIVAVILVVAAGAAILPRLEPEEPVDAAPAPAAIAETASATAHVASAPRAASTAAATAAEAAAKPKPDAKPKAAAKRKATATPKAAAKPQTKAKTKATLTTAAAEESVEGDRLPETSVQSLPPIVIATARAATAPAAVLRRRALASRGVVLAPVARAAIEGGHASAGALDLIVRIGHARHDGPVLVHTVTDGKVRLQATTHADTQTIVTQLRALRREPTVRLQPVAASFADEARGDPEAAASGNIGAQAVSHALKWLGTPYSWGGGNAAGPTLGFCGPAGCQGEHTVGFDCSGLMLYAYAQVGITLDHYAAFQFLEGRRIAVPDLLPGDLLFFHPKADGPGHVGMYIGGGKFVEAPRTGDVVKISDLASRAGSYMGASRPY